MTVVGKCCTSPLLLVGVHIKSRSHLSVDRVPSSKKPSPNIPNLGVAHLTALFAICPNGIGAGELQQFSSYYK